MVGVNFIENVVRLLWANALTSTATTATMATTMTSTLPGEVHKLVCEFIELLWVHCAVVTVHGSVFFGVLLDPLPFIFGDGVVLGLGIFFNSCNKVILVDLAIVVGVNHLEDFVRLLWANALMIILGPDLNGGS